MGQPDDLYYKVFQTAFAAQTHNKTATYEIVMLF